MQTTLSPSSDASFTPKDRQLLAHAPYAKAEIPEQFLRHVVDYPRKEMPGTILVDTDARYLYLVMPEGKAIRYGVAVGEEAMAFSGVARVGRMAEWPDWVPTAETQARLGPLSGARRGRPGESARRAGALSLCRQQGHAVPHPRHQPAGIYRPGDLVRLHRMRNEDVIDLYSRREAKLDRRRAGAGAERADRRRV